MLVANLLKGSYLGRGANTLGCCIHFIPNPSFRPSDFEFPNKFDRRRRRRRRLVELASLRDGKIASLLARRKATSPLSSLLFRLGIYTLICHPLVFGPLCPFYCLSRLPHVFLSTLVFSYFSRFVVLLSHARLCPDDFMAGPRRNPKRGTYLKLPIRTT